jgi:hypothetical protein
LLALAFSSVFQALGILLSFSIYVPKRTSSFNLHLVFIIQPGSTVATTSSVLDGSSFKPLKRKLINTPVSVCPGAASVFDFLAAHLVCLFKSGHEVAGRKETGDLAFLGPGLAAGWRKVCEKNLGVSLRSAISISPLNMVISKNCAGAMFLMKV